MNKNTSGEFNNYLSESELKILNMYFDAANYLTIGQIYLMDNPLLIAPLKLEHIKPRLLGHWGTSPGLNFIYAHLNRIIKKFNLNSIFIAGPGHGGPAVIANTYIEGTYTEYYPSVMENTEGLKKLFKRFSTPGGVASHVTPWTPGSIHEGGELGYALSHAYGAAFDKPDLTVFCVIGDGEAETGPMAASWHINKFLNPETDGIVVPILHLNGYKISNPTLLARISEEELINLFKGYGYTPYLVEDELVDSAHNKMALVLDKISKEISKIRNEYKNNKTSEAIRPLYPMIILKTPKGWTCPKEIDGLKLEGYWRAHQVPITDFEEKPEHIKILENWMKSYKPEKLFDENGSLIQEIKEFPPKNEKRMSANPVANGGLFTKDLILPNFTDYAEKVEKPAVVYGKATTTLGYYLRDIVKNNPHNFRIFSPDEHNSNRLNAVFETTERQWWGDIFDFDDHLAHSGRVIEILSEHTCEGLLEGYLLTGRHGFFSCYEAFIHIIDSMFNQHAKWLKEADEVEWRRPIPSLNYLLTSHVWRQDHNGFSHQDPGFIDHVITKKPKYIRIYLPPDTNTLLVTADKCFRSKNRINVIIAGKQEELQWYDMDSAVKICDKGLGIMDFASNDKGEEPDIVMACAGDVPTLETLAAVSILNNLIPELKIRVVNVIDLMTLTPHEEHPDGLTDKEFDTIFTENKPMVFAFHGYPWLIHRLCYRRKNHPNLHVRGYKEEGTTTTPFDMAVRNDLDRFHLVMDAAERVESLKYKAAYIKQEMEGKLIEHKGYILKYDDDMPEIKNWKW
ncbi:MAG: phosphoketolase family protein [Deltaproteobacteria bacterium]|jgi:xylulose-5-phosphate/fructose-6-phosphate phosphoketolase|nr:phosphoketolase family protein [Deltaproteobacteria bacterium]